MKAAAVIAHLAVWVIICRTDGYGQVPYEKVQSECRQQIEAWSGIPLQNISIKEWHGGSLVIGDWHSQNPKPDSQLVSGSGGTFDLIFHQSLDQSSALVNITGNMFLRPYTTDGTAMNLAVAGAFNSVSGELCLAACRFLQNRTSLRNSISDCEIHIDAKVEYPRFKLLSTKVIGTIESRRASTEPLFFTTMDIDGIKQDYGRLKAIYMAMLAVRFAIIFLEIVLVLVQIYFAWKNVDAYYISTVGLAAQITILGFRWVPGTYILLQYFHSRVRYKLFTWKWTIPFICEIFLISGYVSLLLIVLLKWRRSSHLIGSKVHNVKAQELYFWIIALPLYIVVCFVILWYTHGFHTYFHVVLVWWLLPQIAFNVLWNLHSRPLLPVFIVGVSLCRFSRLTFATFGPIISDYDERLRFPRNCYWGVSAVLVLLVVTAWTQQVYGGKWFIPKRLHGYQQLKLAKPTMDKASNGV